MCGTFEYGLNAAAKEFDGKNKYIRITDIDDASREFLLSDLSSPDICLDGMSKYLLSSGDIVFARTGASVGKTYIYRENDGIVYFAGFLIRAKVNQDNDAEFVFQSTLSPSYEKYIRITSQRSGQPGVNAQEYSEYDLFAPSKEEQQRIGHFLRGIDNLITLHQRKCANLCSPSQVVFSLLFATSTFSWEQRKVSELFRVTRGYVLAATQTETTKTDEKPYPVYSSQTKDKGLMGYYKDYLYEDAITWTTDGANAGTVNYRAGKFYCTNVCGVLLSNEVKANQMIAEALNSVAKGYVSYVGNPKLMNNVMADIVIQIPTQAEEREQLSSFFAKLDNLITLHQRQHFLHSTPDISLSVRLIHPFYTSSWEQRKLGDIVGIYDGVHQTPNYQNSGVMFLSVENIATLKSSKFISEYDFKRDYKVFPQENDILMTRIGDVGTTNVVTDNGLKAYYVSLALLKYKSTDPYFLSNAIQSDYIQKGLANRTLKTAIPMKINKDEIGKVSVMLPLSATEQQQIGTCFRNLDNLITLHQRKGKAAVSGCSNDANNSKGVCCKARDFGYKCHKKDEPNRFDA